MSFDFNPYRVMTLVNDDDGRIYVRCDGCGGDSSRGTDRRAFTGASTFEEFRSWMDQHIWESHRYARKDVAGWGTP